MSVSGIPRLVGIGGGKRVVEEKIVEEDEDVTMKFLVEEKKEVAEEMIGANNESYRDSSTMDVEVSSSQEDSMMSTFSASNTFSSFSSEASGNTTIGGMDEETSKRLANLNKMLSRLAMPRQSVGGGGNTSVSSSGALTSRASGGNKVGSTSGREEKVSNSGVTNTSRSTFGPPRIVGTGPGLGERKRAHGIIGGGSGGGAIEREGKRGDYTVPLDPPGETSSRSRFPSSSSTSRYLSSTTSSSTKRRSSTSISVPNPPSNSNSTSTSTTGRRASTSGVPTSSSTASIAALADGELEARPKTNILRGVVALVDVRTAEGDESGMLFTDMLKNMGARVCLFPSFTFRL